MDDETLIDLRDEEQNLDVAVYPGKYVALSVDIEDAIDSGGVIELSAELMEQILAAWSSVIGEVDDGHKR